MCLIPYEANHKNRLWPTLPGQFMSLSVLSSFKNHLFSFINPLDFLSQKQLVNKLNFAMQKCSFCYVCFS